jgi:hypothetical protein
MPLTQVSPGLLDSNAQYYGFKNRIINPGMVIDQRNAGASITVPDLGYTVDRWKYEASQSNKFNIQQNRGSVTPPAGFSNYLGFATASAVSVGATDYFLCEQFIEGFNTADLAWGTASASPITISFLVRSSLTGTFAGNVQNSANNRFYVFSYTINAANTWEYKIVTIAGDTTGTWATNNTTGILLRFSLGTGSTYLGSAGSWGSSTAIGVTGQTNVVGTLNATWQVTGVQLEKGSTATSFDYRPYGTELAMAQRYCINYRAADAVGTTYTFGTGETPTSTLVQLTMPLPVEMRTTPSLTTTGTASNYSIYSANVNTACSAVPSINAVSNKLTAHMNWTVASGLTAGRAAQCVANANNTAYLLFTAEL